MNYLAQIVRGYKFAGGTTYEVIERGFDSLFEENNKPYFNENYEGNFFEKLGNYLFFLNHPIATARFSLEYLMNKDELDQKLKRKIEETESRTPENH